MTMISEGKPTLQANVWKIGTKGKFLQQQQQ